MRRLLSVSIICILVLFAIYQDRIQSAMTTSAQPSLREKTESATPIPDESDVPRRPDSARVAEVRSAKSDPSKPSIEELGLFLESHGLPRILAKEILIYGPLIHAVVETGNKPLTRVLATDHALTSWRDICVMRLTRKYRLEPEVIGQFFAVVQSNNPALKP
jgi:hypothetical protein